MTYFFQLFPAVAGVHLTGPRNSGKSSSMMLMENLCFNSVYTQNVKPPFLFREAHGTKATVLIDEVEELTSNDKSGDILAILRSRYTKGATVPRTDKGPDGSFTTSYYETYGPTVLASISWLENALMTRMIIIECNSKGLTVDLPKFSTHTEKIKKECLEIRDKLYTLMMLDFGRVRQCYELCDQDRKLHHITDRENQKWLPLFAIAKWIDLSSTHTSKQLFDELIPIQKHKQELLRVSESSTNEQLVVLNAIQHLLTNKSLHTKNIFEPSDIGNGDYKVPQDGFFVKINERLEIMQIQRRFDPKPRAYFENILRKCQVWHITDGIPDKNYLIINLGRVESAIKKIQGE
jgi:hypothetical protein